MNKKLYSQKKSIFKKFQKTISYITFLMYIFSLISSSLIIFTIASADSTRVNNTKITTNALNVKTEFLSKVQGVEDLENYLKSGKILKFNKSLDESTEPENFIEAKDQSEFDSNEAPQNNNKAEKKINTDILNDHDRNFSELSSFMKFYEIELNDFYLDFDNHQIDLNINTPEKSDFIYFSQETLGQINTFVEDYFYYLGMELSEIHYVINGQKLKDLVSQEQVNLNQNTRLNSFGNIQSNNITLCNVLSNYNPLPNKINPLSGISVTLNAGHGYVLGYYNEGGWSLQRGFHPLQTPNVDYGDVGYGYRNHPIVEDFVNAEIRAYLYQKLVNAGANVYPTRETNKESGNGVSGYPRWQEGAKHYLESIGAPEYVYNNSGSSNADYKDWSSKPQWANCVDSDILVSIHNNGFDRSNYRYKTDLEGNPTPLPPATGTETWYYTENSNNYLSSQLANFIHSKLIAQIKQDLDEKKIIARLEVIDIFGESDDIWKSFFEEGSDELTLYFSENLTLDDFNVITDEQKKTDFLNLWNSAGSFAWRDRNIRTELSHGSYYRELIDSEVPTTLLEIAFMNSYLDDDLPTPENPTPQADHALLQSEKGKEFIAEGIYEGILEYFSQIGPNLAQLPTQNILKTHVNNSSYNYKAFVQIQNNGNLRTKSKSGRICFYPKINEVFDESFCYANVEIGELLSGETEDFSFSFNSSQDFSKGKFVIERVLPRETNLDNNTIFISDIPVPPKKIKLKQGSINIPHAISGYRFGIIDTNTRSSKVFTIENGGSGQLTINDISVGGTDADQFQVLQLPEPIPVGIQFPIQVDPHSSFSFFIEFSPTSSGLKEASLTVSSDDPDTAEYQTTLKGIAGELADVSETDENGNKKIRWSEKYVFTAINKGFFRNEIFTKHNERQIEPTKYATRAEILDMIYKASGKEVNREEYPESLGFVDISATDWYYKSVIDAKEKGYVNGKWPYHPQKSHMEALFGEGIDTDKWTGFFQDASANELQFRDNLTEQGGEQMLNDISDHNRKNLIYAMWRYNTFDPYSNVNRAEAVKMIYELVNDDVFNCPSGQINFPDVQEGDWFYPYVCWMATTEVPGFGETIVKGYRDGNFGPGDNITREQMAKITVNIFCYLNQNDSNCTIFGEQMNQENNSFASQGFSILSTVQTTPEVVPHIGNLYEQNVDETNAHAPDPMHLPGGDGQSISSNETFTITGETQDADGDEMFYFWNATGGNFTTTDPVNFSEITWHPPQTTEDTVFTINAVRGDGHGYIGEGTFYITVVANCSTNLCLNSENYNPAFLTSPNGSETWHQGTQENISWTPPTGDTVSFYILTDDPSTLDPNDPNLTDAVNAANWQQVVVAADNAENYTLDPAEWNFLGDTYLLLVSDTGEWDLTNAPFAVAEESSSGGGATVTPTFHSTSTGGDWFNYTTWQENAGLDCTANPNPCRFPDPDDQVEINGIVQVDRNTTIGGVLVTTGSTLKSKYRYSTTYALEVTEDVINNGVIRNGGSSSHIRPFLLTVRGNIENNGSMENSQVTVGKNILNTNVWSATIFYDTPGVKQIRGDGSFTGNISLLADVEIDGAIDLGNGTLVLNNNTLTLNDPSALTVYTVGGGVINGTGELSIRGPQSTSFSGTIATVSLIENGRISFPVIDVPQVIVEGVKTYENITVTGDLIIAPGGSIEGRYHSTGSIFYTFSVGGNLLNDGTVKNGSQNKYSKLVVAGDITNNGSITNSTTTVGGDIVNNGTWSSGITYNTSGLKQIRGSDITASISLEADIELQFDEGITPEGNLGLGDHTLTLNAPHELVVSSVYSNIPNGITGTGKLFISGDQYSNLITDLPEVHFIGYGRANFTALTAPKIFFDASRVLQNHPVITGDVVVAEGATISGLQKPNSSIFYSVTINGDLTNNGTIQNSGYTKFYVIPSGDIINNGTWTSWLTLQGTQPRNITGSSPIAASVLLEDDFEITGNGLFSGSFNMNDHTLTLNAPHALTLGNISGNGVIDGTGELSINGDFSYGSISGSLPEVRFSGTSQRIYGQDLNFSHVIFENGTHYFRDVNISGDVTVASGATVQGNIEVANTYTLTIDGNVANNGTIQNTNIHKKLYMKIAGDIINNGTWQNSSTSAFWAPTSSATSYQFDITDTAGNWTGPFSNTGSYGINNALNTSHSWRYRPVFNDGTTGTWSELKHINGGTLATEELLIQTFSPVDIIVTANGQQTSKTVQNIPESTYAEYDINDDGEINDEVSIQNPTAGEYRIEVISDGTAIAGDTYSLRVISNGQEYTLGTDLPVPLTASDTYSILHAEDGSITIQDITPPAIPTIDPVVTPTSETTQILRGQKEANSSLWLNDEEIIPLNAETTWEYPVELFFGENIFTFSSRDAAGNESAAVTVAILFNTPPIVIAGDNLQTQEGGAIALNGSFIDPDAGDAHTIAWDFGDGTIATETLTPVHTYGDNGVYTVTLTVTDQFGASDTDELTITVANTVPEGSIDTAGAIDFSGGVAFYGHQNETYAYTATASDQGSDDLIFSWSLGAENIYFNNGESADPPQSPAGIFPFTAVDIASTSFAEPGMYELHVRMSDDDGDAIIQNFFQIIIGTAECSQGLGYWKHQFSSNGNQQLEDAILERYIAVIAYASTLFAEEYSLDTFAEIHDLLSTPGNDKRGQAAARLLTAWLNFAQGSVRWNDQIVFDGADMAFAEIITEAEAILRDPSSKNNDFNTVKDMADAVNAFVTDNATCSVQ